MFRKTHTSFYLCQPIFLMKALALLVSKSTIFIMKAMDLVGFFESMCSFSHINHALLLERTPKIPQESSMIP